MLFHKEVFEGSDAKTADGGIGIFRIFSIAPARKESEIGGRCLRHAAGELAPSINSLIGV